MFKKIILKNKINLILSPLHETKAVTVLVLFKVGSRYESKKENGLSHFVEHIMYKGTKKRPSTLSIARELDGVGAEFNAFTSKDYTGYYIKIHHKKIKMALDILSDILINSKFEQKEIKKEKGVIVEEINMYEDNPLIYMEEYFEETIYGDTPLGRLIAGPKENIRRFSRKDLVNYKNKFYRPNNMFIGIAGRFDEENVTNLVKEYFNLPPTDKKIPLFKKYAHSQKKPAVRIKFQDTNQVQLSLGFPGFSYFHKDIYALYLMAIILGGSMSSRLFINVREKKSLCYFIKAIPNIYEDTGNFFIQAGLDKTRIFEAIEIIWEELKKVKKEGVKASELRRAKDFLKGKLVLSLEESNEIASYFTKQYMLTGKLETPEKKFKKAEKVTKEDIQRVASKLFKKNQLNIAVIGPFKHKKEFNLFVDQKLK